MAHELLSNGVMHRCGISERVTVWLLVLAVTPGSGLAIASLEECHKPCTEDGRVELQHQSCHQPTSLESCCADKQSTATAPVPAANSRPDNGSSGDSLVWANSLSPLNRANVNLLAWLRIAPRHGYQSDDLPIFLSTFLF